jgi:hypothetical protein
MSRLLPLCFAIACSGPAPAPAPEPAPAPAPSAAPAPAQAVAADLCTAQASWISAPNPPNEVNAEESFCDFYQFSYQWFLAQMSPAGQGERVFENKNRLVLSDGSTDQCSKPALQGRAAAARALFIRDLKPQDVEDQQADQNPLYDQQGNILYYSIWVSPQLCDAVYTPTEQHFVEGTMEIKAAWRILPAADPTYLSMEAEVPVVAADGSKSSQKVLLGLVGFHIVNWTSKHPEMLWATFEHRANAPDCNGKSATPASGWTFTSKEAAACLAANPGPEGQIPADCAQFSFNTAPKHSGAIPTTGQPDNVCRLYPQGTDPSTAVNGNNNDANRKAIVELEASVQSLLGALPAGDPMAVLQNYTLVGSLWTKGGAASAPMAVPYTDDQGKVVPGDPSSMQRGSLELTDMALETFQQGQTSPIPNCFGCHNYDPTQAVKVSHVATERMLPKLPGAAAAPEPTGKVKKAKAKAKAH